MNGPPVEERPADLTDGAQECLVKEVEFTSREILLAHLKKLARAEEKIREGAYGRCDACGPPIPPVRHVVAPEAVFGVPRAEARPRRGHWANGPYTGRNDAGHPPRKRHGEEAFRRAWEGETREEGLRCVGRWVGV